MHENASNNLILRRFDVCSIACTLPCTFLRLKLRYFLRLQVRAAISTCLLACFIPRLFIFFMFKKLISVPNTGSTVLLRILLIFFAYSGFWANFWCIRSQQGLSMLSSIFLNLVLLPQHCSRKGQFLQLDSELRYCFFWQPLLSVFIPLKVSIAWFPPAFDTRIDFGLY